MKKLIVGAVVIAVLGCGGSGGSTSGTSSSRGGADDATSTAGAEDTPTAAQGSEAPSATQPTSSFGTTPAEAARVCEEIGLEGVTACAFRDGGRVLPGGARADVVEITADDPSVGEIRSAYLVIRTSDEPEYPTTQELGEARDEPGAMMDFEAGPIEVDGANVSVSVRLVYEEYPNTGDPDMDPGTVREEQDVVVTCRAENGVYACERTER